MLSLLVSFVLFMSVFNKTVFSTASIACVYACVLFLVLYVPRFSINKWDVLILCLFYVVPFLWVVISAVHCFVLGNGFLDFLPSTTGRMVNCLLYLCMYLAVRASWQQGLVSTELLLRAYGYGCIVLLILGWWQLAHYIFGIPFLDVETRNFIHSMTFSSLCFIGLFRHCQIVRKSVVRFWRGLWVCFCSLFLCLPIAILRLLFFRYLYLCVGPKGNFCSASSCLFWLFWWLPWLETWCLQCCRD